MKKFSQVNEAKVFLADPSVIKKYAAFIVPLYLNGALKCDERLIEEWIDMNRKINKSKGSNLVLDIEVMAIKQVLDNPLTQAGYERLQQEIAANCPKLERFMRTFYAKQDTFK